MPEFKGITCPKCGIKFWCDRCAKCDFNDTEDCLCFDCRKSRDEREESCGEMHLGTPKTKITFVFR
jgi:hypothetical protein